MKKLYLNNFIIIYYILFYLDKILNKTPGQNANYRCKEKKWKSS